MQIFIGRDDQQYGPYTVEQINEFLVSGHILSTDLAWYEGAAEWAPVASIKGVAIPQRATSNSMPQNPRPSTSPPFDSLKTTQAQSAAQAVDQSDTSSKTKRSMGKTVSAIGAVLTIAILGFRLFPQAFGEKIDCANEAVVETASQVLVKAITKQQYQMYVGMLTNRADPVTQKDFDDYAREVRKETEMSLIDIVTFTQSKGILSCHAVMKFYPLGEPKTEKKLIAHSYSVKISDDGAHFEVAYEK